MRRLFSTFATGLPGIGLLVMRLVVGAVLVAHGIAGLIGDGAFASSVVLLSETALGLLLIAGLWTPIAGTLVAAFELGSFSKPDGDPWTHILLATLGIALALLGPGAWSIDARLFGWKRIDIPDRRPRTSSNL
ncbi:MAG TPA: hypothetical protein VKE96_03835 [Vicinamibacterales bacterium]|nr:hypothetical protein [Vicinamibacterales bacterium]